MPATRSRRRWLPRRTLRLRLTLLYGALFLAAGAILLGITYGLVANSIGGPVSVRGKNEFVVSQRVPGQKPPALPTVAGTGLPSKLPPGKSGLSVQVQTTNGKIAAEFKRLTAANRAQYQALQRKAVARINHQRNAELDALLTRSGVALGIMAILSIGLGWLMAGRALRPVRTMSARAKGISERNLHQRLALAGANDELKELGDTFDGLLGRLEGAFESQRRFVANASHELRTPITLERTLVEVALADPDASVESLRDTCRRVLAAGEQQERLIEALLTLARSQRGLGEREELDLSAVATDVLGGLDRNGTRLEQDLGEAPTSGDPRLVERLVSNLLDNALKYNQEHGWVRVWTGVRAGRPAIEIENSGPAVEADQVAQLTEPFRRLNGDRPASNTPGLGLGLSIVAAIAEAHDAGFAAAPRPGGGLRVEVSFPPV